jgi:hypothetical protein
MESELIRSISGRRLRRAEIPLMNSNGKSELIQGAESF